MYPYNLLYKDTELFPLLGKKYTGSPFMFDFIKPYYESMPVRDVEYMDKHNMKLLEQSGKTWGIGGYLDDRSPKLKGTHIYGEGRVFHLGIDIMTQGVADIYNPLDGRVFGSGFEAGLGNYGGYMIIEYNINDVLFYGLYGHLDESSFTKKDGIILAGEKIGTLGFPEQNGNWVPHLHLQVFTGKDFEKWKFRGYCTLEDLRNMQYICPHPGFLLRWV